MTIEWTFQHSTGFKRHPPVYTQGAALQPDKVAEFTQTQPQLLGLEIFARTTSSMDKIDL